MTLKNFASILAAFTLSLGYSYSEKAIVAKAPGGRFEVVQEYQENWIEIVRFHNPELPEVHLSGWPWPGVYSTSPDGHWLLRTQKTASGESIALLYRIEESGRVLEVLGFDDLLWRASDSVSTLKKKDLYHTAIAKFSWAKNSDFLEIVLRGSNASRSSDGIETPVIYDLNANRAYIKTPAFTSNDEPHR